MFWYNYHKKSSQDSKTKLQNIEGENAIQENLNEIFEARVKGNLANKENTRPKLDEDNRKKMKDQNLLFESVYLHLI